MTIGDFIAIGMEIVGCHITIRGLGDSAHDSPLRGAAAIDVLGHCRPRNSYGFGEFLMRNIVGFEVLFEAGHAKRV